MTDTLTEVQTFIDLGPFAAAHTAAPSDPFGAGRRLLPLREAPVEVGTVRLDPGSGHAPAADGDTFVVVTEGAVELSGLRLTVAESCVVPAGTAFDWTAAAATTLVFMRYTGGTGPAGVVAIENDAPLTPSGAPLAELLVGPTPSCRNHTAFTSADGEFMCGTWDSTPYHRTAMDYRHFELMVLLKGSVTFVDGAGRSGTFSQGDVFLVEQGARCSWESREDVAKIYAIYRPKG